MLDLFAYMNTLSPLPYGPMFIPTVALELQARWFTETIKSCQDHIHKIETTTGMRQLEKSQDGTPDETQSWKNLDLISTTRDLSSLLSRFSFLKLQAETGAYLTKQMELSAASLLAELCSAQNHDLIDSQTDTISKIIDLQDWYLGIMNRCKYLSERTAAQTQTVCVLAALERRKEGLGSKGLGFRSYFLSG